MVLETTSNVKGHFKSGFAPLLLLFSDFPGMIHIFVHIHTCTYTCIIKLFQVNEYNPPWKVVSRASPSYAEREREGLENRAHPACILGMYDASRGMFMVATN